MEAGGSSYPGPVAGECACEDKALDALLEAGDVLDLQKVALHSAQELGVAHPLMLGMLALQPPCSPQYHPGQAS